MNTKKIEQQLNEEGIFGIAVSEKNGCVALIGELEDYAQIVRAGQIAAREKHSRGVLNDIVYRGYTPRPMSVSSISDKAFEGRRPDILIVGGGIIGCAVARELSRYSLDIMLCEKECDIAMAQSSSNDGMIHAGIDLNPFCIKVKYNMRGSRLYNQLSQDMNVPIRRSGQYVLYTSPYQRLTYPVMRLWGAVNRIRMRYALSSEISRKLHGTQKLYGGSYYPDAGVISPYNMTIALAENAVTNGVQVCLNTAVLDIHNDGKRVISVTTNRGVIYPTVLINCAGVYSDVIAEQAGDRHFTIHPRKGTIAIFDKKSAQSVTSTVIGRFALRSRSAKHTKGGGIINTIDHNILIGPNAVETPEREDYSTSQRDLDDVFAKQSQSTDALRRSDIITYFAGVRAATYGEQFIVERSPVISNLVEAAGIQSPGITAAPAIAERIVTHVQEVLGTLTPRADFIAVRKAPVCPAALSDAERDQLIRERPDYGEIVCRCEGITKGEILDAIHRPVGATTIDGVKRRVRAGMGRCQGGFCSPIIAKILAEELGVDITEITKKGSGSELVLFHTKEATGE